MIIRQQRPSFATICLGGLALSAATFSAYWWTQAQHKQSDNGGVVLASPSADVQSAFTATSNTPTATARPSELSPGDWAALNTALAYMPAPQAEAQRLANYIRYQQDFDFWQNSTQTTSTVARKQLAEDLLKQLPDRVARGEFTGTEGMLMASVLVNDLEPTDGQRQKRIDDWGNQLNMTAPQPTNEQELAARDRETMHKRKRADAFLTWQSQPAASRQQTDLNQAMSDVETWFKSGAD